MLNIRFKLSFIKGRFEDMEFMANSQSPDITIVTWVEDGQLHKVSYDTDDVETYFLDGSWIEII